jgi:PAS domain-containing protein
MGLARSNLVMTVLIISTAAMFAMVLVFMVAAWWLRRGNDRKAARWAALEARWQALLESIAAGELAEAKLHAQVSSGERLTFLDFLYKQVIREERAERVALCRRLAVPYLGTMAGRVRTGDIWQRARAVRTLAELWDGAHSGAIVEALDDPAAHVAQTAARAYARLGLGPVDALLDRLDRYQPWDRRLLRQTLAAVGPEGAPRLLASLRNPAVAAPIRVICADALAALSCLQCNETALELLRSESDVELRAAALRLLRGDVTDEQLEAVRALRLSPEPVLQGQAVACLARIGKANDLTDLEADLNHSSPWVRFNAARGLKQRGTAVPVLAGAGANGQE